MAWAAVNAEGAHRGRPITADPDAHVIRSIEVLKTKKAARSHKKMQHWEWARWIHLFRGPHVGSALSRSVDCYRQGQRITGRTNWSMLQMNKAIAELGSGTGAHGGVVAWTVKFEECQLRSFVGYLALVNQRLSEIVFLTRARWKESSSLHRAWWAGEVKRLLSKPLLVQVGQKTVGQKACREAGFWILISVVCYWWREWRRITDLFTGELTDGTMASWTVWLPLISHEHTCLVTGSLWFANQIGRDEQRGEPVVRYHQVILDMIRNRW